ncbi:filamentous hemagglutinin N-terminal domain-containing protein [Simiduia agarivorans]|uniref:Filamentous haemagglutinin FhaB/tRNA nuclease CdiA-like TPS domain-containing protein n=1 Tax=Simiduia agarivorans (strain DSM 21679 / JCM 13881 / BCRC 17597 / SA1) TaxID=1117647 RepID=K4KHB4_SIMAS|nr:filamentous hemagglutinin N-terminal domain-containing protein [Simiduia agarivorans]AFU98401.1 hypothetical protein M5M_06020 [Simiduia agarivorans SA1 = DSM 21679]
MTSHRSLHATPKRIAAAIASALASGFLHATPSTPVVTNGQAQVEQHPGNMIIHQTSQRAVLEYQQFSIGAGESVQFIQPNAQSLTLNKVTGPDASQIAGQLSANGHVYLVNPNGVFFSPGAQVDVTGLVVTTLDIDRDDFMSGDFTLHSPGNGEIVNQADINADALLAFVAPFIRNEGTLAADKQVQLLAEDTLVITPNGEHTGIAVSRDAIAESDRTVINQGDIKGHWVVLSAGAVDALHQSLVDNAGAVRAHSLADLTGGAIEAAASSVNNTGTLLADAQGEIVITGDYLYNNGHMATPGGTISLNAEKVLVLDHQSEQDASATTTGDGGSVINYAKGFAHFNADARIAARGGSESGNGGFVEVSGIDYVEAYGLVDTRAANGTTGTYLIDPTDITISAAAESGGAFGGPPYNWVPSGASSNIDVGILQTNLQTSSVTINTASGFAGTGDITIATDIDIDGSGANVLNLIADNNIIMNAGTTISDSNTGTVESMQLNMQAGGNLIMATTASLSLGGGKFGGVFGGNADISAIVSLNNAADAITLAVGDTLTDIHGATNNFITPGGVIITAGTVNPLLVSVNSMDLTTTVGNATITSSGAISFSDIDTAGNATINMSAGALTIAGFTDAANLTLNAGAGNVILPDAGIAITGNVNITAGDLLDADRSVILSGNNLVLNTGIAAGDLTINGNFNTVDLTQTGTNTLTYDDADTVAINNFSVTGGGGLDILSFGDMNIATDIDYDGNNGAALTIGSYANNLLLNANILDSNTGTNDAIGLVLTAGNNLVMLDTSQVDINNGVLLVNATGDVTLGNLASTNNTGVAITVTAGNRILDGGDTFTDIVAVNGNTHLTAVNGISDIEIQTERLSLTNTGSGNTTVTETNTVIMDTINTVGTATINATARIEIADGVVVSAQNLTLNSTDLQLGNAGIANVSGTLNIAADNIYDADQTVNLAAGTLVLNTNLAGGDLVVNSTINNADISLSSANSFTLNNTGALSLDNLIMGTGTYQINSTGNLTLANTIDTNSSIGATLGLNSSGGDLLINANIEDTIASGDNVTINLDAGNDIIMLDGTVVSANDADITLNAGNNVVVSSLHSTNTAGLAITVTAGNQIIDGGDLDQDIRPLGGRASLTAVNGIGMGNAIETRGTALDLFNTGSGDIEAYNFSGTMDVRTLNNVGNTYLSSADAIKIQSGAVVATQDLSLIATTNIELPDTAIANIAGTFTLSGTDIFDSDRTVAFAAIPVDITTATAGGDSVFGLTGSSITLNNTGTSLITLNKTNAGNLAIVNGDTGSGDLSVNLLDGLLQVNNTATGLRTAGALSISANSIFDVPNDGVVTLRGSSVNLNLLQTSTALQTNLFTNQLTLTGPSATNLTVQRNSGDLNINAINWAGDLTFNLNSGRLILNNSGLTSAGTLTLSADDLLDSDRTLILTANNLNLASGFTGGDLTLNTTVANLGITNSGINALTVNETDALTLTSLNSTGALSISNAGNLTLGPVAAVTDLDLTSTGDVITDDTGLNNVSGTLVINAADLRDSDRSVSLGAGTLTLASGFIGGDLTLNTTAANLGITNSGTNALTVNETDALTLTSLNSTGALSISNAGNLTLAPVTAVTDLNLTSTGDVITDDTGLNNVSGTLVINAADLRDSDRNVTLQANTASISLAAQAGATAIDSQVTNLNWTGSNALTLTQTGALQLNADMGGADLSIASNDNILITGLILPANVAITTSGTLQLPDALPTAGSWQLTAADLFDSDRQLTLNGANLFLDLSAPGGNLAIASNAAQADLNFANHQLTLDTTPAGALALNDLDSDGFAAQISNGSLRINLLQNDLFINSDMQATDTVADGTRHGKLGIFLSGGNLTLANGVTLAALNNVENSIGGGWDNDQTALLIRQLDQTDTSYTWTIGTNALLEAQGGDLVLDNYNDAALNTGVRTITLNTGSSLRSYNSLGDSQTGTVINQSVDASNATLSAYANRQLALLTEAPTPTPTPVPTPVPTPMPTPTPERPVDLDSVQNDLSKPTENTETSTPNETANPSVDNLLTRATGACQPDNSSQDTSPRCKNQAAIERFLGSLLIGGQLPQVGDSSK